MKHLLSVLLAVLMFPVAAQDYPGKSMRIIVPFPAGGSTDVLARMVAQKLNEEIKRIVDTAQTKGWLLNNLGGEFTPNTPEQFSAFLDTDATHWRKIIKHIGLRLD